ncbi:MAG: corrinoid activation/regeneration protein AcsV [Termitinemataceae bacterium]|nr:MAG: corrinoid activation/regeneration protein AcsV [Termitinemataceae bacterium]
MAVKFIIEGGEPVVAQTRDRETILDAAKRSGVVIDAPCGGNGTCGKCRIKLLKGELLGEKTKYIDDTSWKDGWRLACSHKPAGEVEIFVPAEAAAFQNRIRVTDFSGTREKAAFNELRAVLTELKFTGDHGLEITDIELNPPSLDDAHADRERFIAAVSEKTGIEETQVRVSINALRRLPVILREANFKTNVVLRRENDGGITVLDVCSDVSSVKLPGLAIDIGTTTVSMLLVELATGEPIASASGGNAQIRYGADVINRIIESTKAGGLVRLRKAVIDECLTPLIMRLCSSAGIDATQIYRVVVAGNTTMTHLFLGVPPDYLRLEPYVPAFFDSGLINAGEAGLPVNGAAELVIAPSIGSYVGGDITAGVLAADFYRKETFSLFIDLGTNGELVFGSNEFLFSCACSAGPAFEGGEISCGMRATNGAIEKCFIDEKSGEPKFSIIGEAGTKPAGLCGSGLIDIIGELFRCGLINAKGKFITEGKRIVKDEYGGAGYVVAFEAESEAGRGDIILSESDIDNFVRAKGAIFSAIRTMLAIVDFSIDTIEDVYVAGGIGSGIDIDHAIMIGMFPKLPKEKYKYIGNSSLSGAYAMLNSRAAAQKVTDIASGMTYIELSSHPSYMDEFVAACFLPHTDAGLFS